MKLFPHLAKLIGQFQLGPHGLLLQKDAQRPFKALPLGAGALRMESTIQSSTLRIRTSVMRLPVDVYSVQECHKSDLLSMGAKLAA